MSTVERRPLDFHSYDELIADIDRLAAEPHRQTGQWDLATMCDHLAKTMNTVSDNRRATMPFIVRFLSPVIGPMMLKRTLKTRSMPAGFKAPPEFTPDNNLPVDVAVARLKAAIARAKALSGPVPKHPFFGRITVEQRDGLAFVHAAHHLSFLLPGEPDHPAGN
jgi:hypothetical protein